MLSSCGTTADASNSSDNTKKIRHSAPSHERFIVENSIIRDEGLSVVNVLDYYPVRERQLILQDQGLMIAINSAFYYSVTETLTLHTIIDEVIATAFGPVSKSSIVASEFTKLPPNVQRIIRIMDEEQFKYLFHMHRAPYSYINFLKAAAKWPRFCGEILVDHPLISTVDKSSAMETVCKGEMSSMFVHFAQEVGLNTGENSWREGLYFSEELGCENLKCVSYNAPCSDNSWTQFAYPCSANVTFHGRGAKQLSYNYNYGSFSRIIYNDFTLLTKPELVTKDGFLAIASAMYFYMTPRSPKPSIHQTVTGLWLPSIADKNAGRDLGFAVQTLIINGCVECGKKARVSQANNRANHFEKFSVYFGIWDSWFKSTQQHCDFSQTFSNDISSSTYYKGFIAKQWDGSCDYVGWEETGFSALFPGDLELCEQSVAEKVYPSFPSTFTAFTKHYN